MITENTRVAFNHKYEHMQLAVNVSMACNKRKKEKKKKETAWSPDGEKMPKLAEEFCNASQWKQNQGNIKFSKRVHHFSWACTLDATALIIIT